MTSTNKKKKKADNFLWLRGDSLELYAVIQFKQYFEKKTYYATDFNLI